MADGVDPPVPVIELRRASTAEQVAAALRERIADGAIAPGTHLGEVVVSQRLGVSRNTVREALQILDSQGIVRREAHRGARVAQLGADDVRDLMRVRRLVEPPAVREAARRGVAPDELTALTRRLETLDPAAALAAELDFWHGLVAAVEGERLVALHASAVNELRLVCARARAAAPAPRSVRPLRSLLSAVRRGDGERAASLVARRLERDERLYLGLLGATAVTAEP